MAQHTHKHAPGTNVTHTAGAAVTAGQLVMITGDREVEPATANTTAWCGTAATAATQGDHVLILTGGTQTLTASGTINPGDPLIPAADGKVAALAAVTTPTANDVTHTRAIVGVALTGGTDVAVEVQMAR